MTEEQLELELERLKELNRNIILALERAKKDLRFVHEYDRCVQEYEDAKNELFRKLQERGCD